AAQDDAGESTEIRAWPVHPLHGHAEGPGGEVLADWYGFEMLEKSRSPVPRHCIGAANDVVAVDRRDRDAGDVFEADSPAELAIVALDSLEHLLRVVDEIDLV